jgi:predicted nucleotide-binding protein
MDYVANIFAKLAGVRKALADLLNDEFTRKGVRPLGSFDVDSAGTYVQRGAALLAELKKHDLGLYGDVAEISPEPSEQGGKVPRFARAHLERLLREIDAVFEIRAASAPASRYSSEPANSETVFISHGRSEAWREVQSYVEKDVRLDTRELAQEPNGGDTVGAKLERVAAVCDSAVIVMTGDDLDAEGLARARENVMHEIGYFQGRLGAKRVCLLHEEGVSIPSNLAGIVYVPFPKGHVTAALATLRRELEAIYGMR